MIDRKAIGSEGERLGRDFLKKSGYRLIEQNFKSRHGEIDLIAVDKDDIVFIEVKLRQSADFGMPCEAVNRRKQDHIVKTALNYLKAKNLMNKNVRFDVMSIGPEPGKIELIRSAFTVSPKYTY